jgi:hypothetical protein
MMNYKSIALAELNSFAKEYPEYTLAEVLYSFLRTKSSGCESINDIQKMSDETLYNVIENARDNEKEQ